MSEPTAPKRTLECKDEVLQEIWRVKDEMSAKYAGDLDRFFDDLREHQKESEKAGFRVVDLSSMPPRPAGD